VDTNKVFLRGGRDGEGVPLEGRYLGAVKEKVLARLVLHGGLLYLDLNNLGGVLDDLGDIGLQPAADFPYDPLHHVEEHTSNAPLPGCRHAGKLAASDRGGQDFFLLFFT